MTKTKIKGDAEYAYHIPSLTRDKQPIPLERRKEYRKALETRALYINGGFYIISNGKGGYRSKSGEIMYEDIEILHTSGNSLLDDKDLEAFTNFLDQESLLVAINGECKAYFYDGKTEDVEFHYDHKDGSRTEYRLMNDPDTDEQCIQVMHYNADGTAAGWKTLHEPSVAQEVALGDEFLSKIYENYWAK